MNGPAAPTFAVAKARTAAATASAPKRATFEGYPRAREFTLGAGHLRRDLRSGSGTWSGADLALGQSARLPGGRRHSGLAVPRGHAPAWRPRTTVHADRPGRQAR